MFQKVKVLLQTLRLCSSNSQAVLQQHRRDSLKAQGNGENGFLQLIKRFPSLSLRLCLQDRFSVCCTPFPLALVSNSILKSQSVPQNFLQHVPQNINIIITIILYHVFKTNIHRGGKFYTVHAWVASPVSPSCLVCHYTAFQAHRTSFSVSKINTEKICSQYQMIQVNENIEPIAKNF